MNGPVRSGWFEQKEHTPLPLRYPPAMRLSRPGSVVVSLLALGGLVATGCSSSKSSTVSASTTAASTSTTTAGPADATKLQSIVVQAVDLPAGWNGSPSSPENNPGAEEAAIASCLGIRNTYPDRVASVDSQDFSMGEAQIGSTASSYRNEEDITSDLAALNNPNASSCYERQLKDALTAALPQGSVVGDTTVHITPGTNGGPANVAGVASATMSVSVNGQPLTFFTNITFIKGPKLEVTVNFFNTGSELPQDLRSQVVQKVAARAAQG